MLAIPRIMYLIALLSDTLVQHSFLVVVVDVVYFCTRVFV